MFNTAKKPRMEIHLEIALILDFDPIDLLEITVYKNDDTHDNNLLN
jgi:hypothetical protein